jgi:hypothetical protein
MDRLLLLSCSRSKRAGSHLLPAYQRYDGPAFRLLRRYLKISSNIPTIKILSAEFGLIPYDFLIPNYDRHMTMERALELQSQVTKELKRILVINRHNPQVFIYLGKCYLKTIEVNNVFPSSAMVKITDGTPGKRLADLYKWLYGDHGVRCQISASSPRASVRIRGIEIKLTVDEVLNTARLALAGSSCALDYGAWYVLVDGRRVPIKWLVSALTGLPLNAFHTDEAKRVLSQLGLQVQVV